MPVPPCAKGAAFPVQGADFAKGRAVPCVPVTDAKMAVSGSSLVFFL